MLKFNNLLLENRLILYRKDFEKIIGNKFYGREWSDLTLNEQTNERADYFRYRYTTCRGCCSVIYIPSTISNYDLYNRYQFKPLYEDFYFRVKDFSHLVQITGKYDIMQVNNGLQYKSDDLYLNGLPVNYIHGYLNNVKNGRDKVLHLQFSFNLKRYIDMINYVLACYYRRLKYILFSYLPLELIKEILTMTSLMI